jgi:hypothetical protein
MIQTKNHFGTVNKRNYERLCTFDIVIRLGNSTLIKFSEQKKSSVPRHFHIRSEYVQALTYQSQMHRR